MIHVAVIVGSYGPFALSMIIGYFFDSNALNYREKSAKIKVGVKNCPLSMNSLFIGLIMSQETSGRYVGQRELGSVLGLGPKETWALISIMVYAFVFFALITGCVDMVV